jgi:hypothetical protein
MGNARLLIALSLPLRCVIALQQKRRVSSTDARDFPALDHLAQERAGCVIVLLQRPGNVTGTHALLVVCCLLPQQVEDLPARPGATHLLGAAQEPPLRGLGLEAQGQFLLALDIAPGHEEGCVHLPALALEDQRAIDGSGHAGRAGDLVEHIGCPGLAQVMHRQDRDLVGLGQPLEGRERVIVALVLGTAPRIGARRHLRPGVDHHQPRVGMGLEVLLQVRQPALGQARPVQRKV